LVLRQAAAAGSELLLKEYCNVDRHEYDQVDRTIFAAPAFYTFFCMFTGTILAWYWSGKKHRSQDRPTIPA